MPTAQLASTAGTVVSAPTTGAHYQRPASIGPNPTYAGYQVAPPVSAPHLIAGLTLQQQQHWQPATTLQNVTGGPRARVGSMSAAQRPSQQAWPATLSQQQVPVQCLTSVSAPVSHRSSAESLYLGQAPANSPQPPSQMAKPEGGGRHQGHPGGDPISPSDALSLGINLEQYISRRNERERSRVRNVNDAFDNLKNSLPLDIERLTKRMSKVEILRTAIGYIRNLENVLGGQQQAASKQSCEQPADQTAGNQLTSIQELAGDPPAEYQHQHQHYRHHHQQIHIQNCNQSHHLHQHGHRGLGQQQLHQHRGQATGQLVGGKRAPGSPTNTLSGHMENCSLRANISPASLSEAGQSLYGPVDCYCHENRQDSAPMGWAGQPLQQFAYHELGRQLKYEQYQGYH